VKDVGGDDEKPDGRSGRAVAGARAR